MALRVQPALDEARTLARQMMDLIPEVLAIGNLISLSGGFDFRKHDLGAPMPELPESNAGKSHSAAIMSVDRRHRFSILETARYFAEGRYLKMVGALQSIADTITGMVGSRRM